MKAHRASYKLKRLGVTADGIWRSNGQQYPHILPESLFRLNIIELVRQEFWEYFDERRATLALHTDFHHLNSSQAFAFNMFFPWVGLGYDPEPLFTALELQPERVRAWAFEFMPDQAEGTAVDVHVELESDARLLIEVKLTENHFGTCDPNEGHRRKLREIYAPQLASKVEPNCLEEEVFFLNYQLFRNLSHLDLSRRDRLVLLLPRANELTWQEGTAFYEQRLTHTSRDSVSVVAVEDVLSRLMGCAETCSPRLQVHLESLGEKYLVPAAV
jgi:hypothetical protein